jgi:hypothetical protein
MFLVSVLFPNQDFVNISYFLKVLLPLKSLQRVQIGRPYYVQIGILAICSLVYKCTNRFP